MWATTWYYIAAHSGSARGRIINRMTEAEAAVASVTFIQCEAVEETTVDIMIETR